MVAVWNSGISVVAKNSLKLFSQPGSENSTPGRSAQRIHVGAWLLQVSAVSGLQQQHTGCCLDGLFIDAPPQGLLVLHACL